MENSTSSQPMISSEEKSEKFPDPNVCNIVASNRSVKNLIQKFLESNPKIWESGHVYFSKKKTQEMIDAIRSENSDKVQQLLSEEKRFCGKQFQSKNDLLELAPNKKNIEIIHPWNIFSVFIRNSVDSMWSQKFQFLELTKIDDLRERPNLHWRKQKFYLGKSILEKKSVILSVVNLRRKQQSGDNSRKERSGCVTVRFRRNQIG